MASDDSPFLSRWSRRKVQVREGLPVESAPLVAKSVASAASTATTLPLAPPTAPLEPAAQELQTALQTRQAAPTMSAEPATPPALTLDDVALLTRESDYSGFVARGVTPEVRNAALKKLFADPHFNVMDGLDTYIADYGLPDPLPEGMLRQMVQSKFLGLFDDDPPQPESDPDASAVARPSIPALAATPPNDPSATIPAHEDADLQLQPDDAAGRTGAAPGPGQDSGRQH